MPRPKEVGSQHRRRQSHFVCLRFEIESGILHSKAVAECILHA